MKRMTGYLIMFMLLFLLSGCQKEQVEQSGDKYQIYEMNKDETTIQAREYVTQETNKKELVKLLLEEMMHIPENTERKAVLGDMAKMEGYLVNDETITIDFALSYEQLSLTGEVLTRAAVVRTLTQIAGISYISFTVDGMPLANKSGVPIGMMTAEQFIDNSGNEINTEEKVQLTLYYANADGNQLVRVPREVVYNSNISLEKLVMEQLVTGTFADEIEQYGAVASVSPDTKVISVMVSDGICYVNIDGSFLTLTSSVSPEVTLYSMVNSLVELSNINKVQFSINGEKDVLYKETLSLSETYERNLELLEVAQ